MRLRAWILISFILAIIYSSVLASFFYRIKVTQSSLLLSSLFNLILLGGGGLLAAYMIHGSFKSAAISIGFRREGMEKGILYGIIAILSFIFLLSIFLSITGFKGENKLAKEIASSINIPLLIIIPLFSSLSEEIFFRGLIFSHLNEKFGWISSAIITSILFSFAHLEYKSLFETIATFIFSIILCYLIKSTKNIISPITAHFMYDFLALLSFYLK